MADIWKCKECEESNSINVENCRCGAERPLDRNPGTAGRPHGSCCVPRCPMSGTFSASIRGGENWYCSYHWDNRTDYAHCARITEELLQNRPPVFGAKANGKFVNTFPKD